MSDTTPQELLVTSFGANKTTSGNYTKASRGFTARRLQFPEEGLSTTNKMELITGFTPKHNANTQSVTLPSVSVSDNTPSPFVMSIRPVQTTSPNLYRVKDDDSTSLQSMNYDFDNSTEVDRTSYLFSQTKLGSSVDLHVTGKVPLAQYGFKYTTGGSGTPTTYGSTNGMSGSPTPTLTSPNNSSVDADVAAGCTTYGYWPVKTTIQAVGTLYDSFILKAGSPVLGDDVLQDLSGHAVKFSDMNDISDGSGNFLADFLVTPSKYQIVKAFTTNNVTFKANSSIPEGTLVFIGDFVSTSSTPAYTSVQYAYGVYPSYLMKFYEGTVIDVPVTLYDGFSVPAGFIAEAGTTTNDVDSTIITSTCSLSNVRAEPGFLLPADVNLTRVVLNGSKSSIKKGTSSAQMQPIPLGASCDSVQTLNGVQLLTNASLPSELEFTSRYETPNDISTHRGTLLTKGSILPKGAKTLEGAQIVGELIISSGSTVTDDFDIDTPFVITDSNTSQQQLSVGAKLKAPFVFPPGTQITNGNILPAAFKILMSMGVSLAAGMELVVGTIFGAGAMLYGNLGFKPNGCIPARSTLYGTVTIPTGSKLEKDTTLNVSLPVPNGVKFHTNDTLHAGTTIREGTPLPPMQDLSAQAVPATGSVVGPLSTFTDSGIQYLVVKAKTAFMAGFVLPVGSILSKTNTAGTTYRLGIGSGATNYTSGTGSSYTLQSGEFSFDTRDRSPAASDFTFTVGVPTDTLIVLLTDVVFDTDIVLPLAYLDVEAGSLLAMNEPFTLASDLVLSNDYTVHGNNTVMWPANNPIPSDFVFGSPYTFTAPSGGTQLDKKLQFNFRTTNDYIYDILTSSSYVKLPPSGYKLESAIKLAVDQPVAGSGIHALKTTVELAKGSKLNTTGGRVTLQHPMPVEDDFTVGAAITSFPRIFLQNGLSLLAGHTTPGDIHVTSGTGLPKNVNLPQSVTLSTDHTVAEDDYTIPQYSVIESGSKLSRRTSFPSGFSTTDTVKLYPFLSLTSENLFIVNEENEFSSDIQYPYLVNESSNQMDFMKLDNRGSLQEIKTLRALIEALQLREH